MLGYGEVQCPEATGNQGEGGAGLLPWDAQVADVGVSQVEAGREKLYVEDI